jgi:dihydroorotate dehydrogenase (fumarate)
MNLTSRYLGLDLAHPIVAAASPLTATLDGMRRLEDAGAAAVVMSSLYEEQIRAEDTAYALYTEHGSDSQPEASTYFPELADYDNGVSGHLETLLRASQALEIPVIASLNGTTSEGWIENARRLEQAGAAAIELNVYSIPVDLAVSGAELERRYVEIVREVRSSVRIPIAVKLAPYFTSLPHMAAELVRAGADGLVLFNRYYAPDIDLLTLRVTRALPLSTAAELPLSLVWIALLSRRLACSLAASRGDGCRGRQVPARGRGHRHDSVGSVAAWAGARGDHARGTRTLARHERLRLGRRDPRPEGRDARGARRRPVPRAIRRKPHRILARQARLGSGTRH